MYTRSSVRLAVAVLCVALITSCGGSGTANPPLQTGANPTTNQYPPGTKVAVVGDTEADVSANIQTAQKLGLSPQYIGVQTSSHMHVFTVYSQVLRSQQALIVRAYGYTYVFDLNGTSVSEGGAAIASASFPLVGDAFADKTIASGQQPDDFKFNEAVKSQLCPDCVMMVLHPHPPASWAALQDPWQVSPTYIAWAPAASNVGKPAPQLPALAGSSYSGTNCRLTSKRGEPAPDLCISCTYGSGCRWVGGPPVGGGASGGSGGSGLSGRPHKGYNTLAEGACNAAGGGIYISLENVNASNGTVRCAVGLALSMVQAISQPNGCPVSVTAIWAPSGYSLIRVAGNLVVNYPQVKTGMRIGLACDYYIDGNAEGDLLKSRSGV